MLCTFLILFFMFVFFNLCYYKKIIATISFIYFPLPSVISSFLPLFIFFKWLFITFSLDSIIFQICWLEMFLSIPSSIYPSIYFSIHLFMHLFLSIYLSLYPSIHLSVYLIHLFIYPFIHQFIIYPFIHPSNSQSIYPSIKFFILLSIHPPIYLSIYKSINFLTW